MTIESNLCFERSPDQIHNVLMATTDKEDFERGLIGLCNIVSNLESRIRVLEKELKNNKQE